MPCQSAWGVRKARSNGAASREGQDAGVLLARDGGLGCLGLQNSAASILRLREKEGVIDLCTAEDKALDNSQRPGEGVSGSGAEAVKGPEAEESLVPGADKPVITEDAQFKPQDDGALNRTEEHDGAVNGTEEHDGAVNGTEEHVRLEDVPIAEWTRPSGAVERGPVVDASMSEVSEHEGILLDEEFGALLSEAFGDVADPKRANPRRHFLRNICALSNAPQERKAEAVRGIRARRSGSKQPTIDARSALALLEAVERAARPFLCRNPATGRFEVGRTAKGAEIFRMDGWHEVVVRDFGYTSEWAHLAPRTEESVAGQFKALR